MVRTASSTAPPRQPQQIGGAHRRILARLRSRGKGTRRRKQALALHLDDTIDTSGCTAFSRSGRNSIARMARSLYLSEMHQIKIFKGIENEAAGLEKQINTWLAGEAIRVISISGNIAPQSPPPEDKAGSINQSPWAPSDLLVIVHYEK